MNCMRRGIKLIVIVGRSMSNVFLKAQPNRFLSSTVDDEPTESLPTFLPKYTVLGHSSLKYSALKSK